MATVGKKKKKALQMFVHVASQTRRRCVIHGMTGRGRHTHIPVSIYNISE